MANRGTALACFPEELGPAYTAQACCLVRFDFVKLSRHGGLIIIRPGHIAPLEI